MWGLGKRQGCAMRIHRTIDNIVNERLIKMRNEV